MAETVHVLRGDPLTIRLADLTMDGAPWTTWESYNPVAHVRPSERGTLAAEFTFANDAGDMLLSLTGAETEALEDRVYVWDVEFTDPDTDDPFTWPGPGLARNRLAVGSDVTRVVVTP